VHVVEHQEPYIVPTGPGHPFFKRQGNDIIYELRINSTQAVHGDKVKVPTDGPLADLKIPPGTPGDTSFRLKGMASQSFIAVHAATST